MQSTNQTGLSVLNANAEPIHIVLRWMESAMNALLKNGKRNRRTNYFFFAQQTVLPPLGPFLRVMAQVIVLSPLLIVRYLETPPRFFNSFSGIYLCYYLKGAPSSRSRRRHLMDFRIAVGFAIGVAIATRIRRLMKGLPSQSGVVLGVMRLH